ncbi:MAG: P-loop NTPase fold protein [Clostridia bacterium]
MEELLECIVEYVRKPITDYAIMINGEWGSGKTYFWNNKVREKLETMVFNGKKYKTIYMSLYGINSLEEISKKIFIETNHSMNKSLKKFTDNKGGNTIPEYVKTGLDMANLFGATSFNGEKMDFSKAFSIEDKILCFDDLERANVDVIDILGYINNFVEHDGIKTIVICNEKELATKFKNTNVEMKTFIATYILAKEGKIAPNSNLPKASEHELEDLPLTRMLEEKVTHLFDKANAYERIKEKLIGETFEYIPEYSYILTGMIMRYSFNPVLESFLKKNSPSIIAVFNKTGTRNLRILKHALNDFEKIFSVVQKYYPNLDDEIMKTLLMFTVAIAFEIKSGNVTKEKFVSIRDNDEYKSVIFTSKILNDNNQFYLREFDNKYFFNSKSEFRFFKFVEVYIRTRIFDMKLFRMDMEAAQNTDIVEDNTPKYITILTGEYWKLADNEFDGVVKQTLEEIKEGKLPLDKYLKAFAVYQYFVSKGLLNLDIETLKNLFTIGIKRAAVDENNDTNFSIQDVVNYETNDIYLKEIKVEVIRANKELLERVEFKRTNEIFKHIPDNMEEFYKVVKEEYANVPIFKNYDMYTLMDRLALTNNYHLYNIINIIQMRYEGKPDLLKLDSRNLKLLSNLITEHVITKQPSIKMVQLGNIKDSIEDILKTIQD